MKKLYLISILVLLATVFSSCRKTVEDLFDKKPSKNTSQISVYPIFDVIGGERILWTPGTAWVDPGVKVSEVQFGDNDLAGVLKTTGTIDVNTLGVYVFTYTAANKFNYVSSVTRSVLVTGDIAGNPNAAGKYKITSTAQMDVTAYDVVGFYHATNIYSPSVVIPADFADIGTGHYVIIPGSVSVGTATYTYKGTVVRQTNGDLWFSVYLNGAATPSLKKWLKI
jgi:hypothetical protein